MGRMDVYADVTSRIVRMMEEGAADPSAWRAPWRAIGQGHRSAVGRSYRGVNTLLLADQAQRHAYELPVWATYKQWEGLGAQVRRGEKATRVILWKQATPRQSEDASEGEAPRRGLFATTFCVFNADQVDGSDTAPALENLGTVRNPDGRDDAAESWIAATGAEISHGGDRAYYTPAADRIWVPHFEDFDYAAGYYATAAHELTHWTAHPSRLARDLSGRFGTRAYAAEELIAELGAVFAMARLGLEGEPRADHAHYLASWAELLRDNHRAIFTAATRAQSACDYLFGEVQAED